MNKFNDSQHAFALTEVMIAVGIMSIVSLGASQIILSSMELDKQVKEKTVQLERIQTSANLLSKQEFLKKNRNLNTNWLNCFTQLSGCSKTGNSYNKMPINLYQFKGTSQVKIIGTPQSPVYYDGSGKITSNMNQANFSISATVQAVCRYQCAANSQPELLVYELTINKKLPSTSQTTGFVKINQMLITEEVKPRTEVKNTAQDCGKADTTYYKYTRSINSGTLDCSWAEATNNLPSQYKGKTGAKGDAVQGNKGIAGKSRCHAENVAALLSMDTIGRNAGQVASNCNP